MLNDQSAPPAAAPWRSDAERRRLQLIEVTIAAMAEVGFEGATLAEIAGRAGVSPGLVAHHFESKDGLLAAAFRSLVKKVGLATLEGLRAAATPRERLNAVIDAHLGDQDFDERAGAAWLAFWGHVPHDARLRRLQRVYQRRMRSNLGDALARLAVSREEARALGGMVAAMIDGVWLRAALSGWTEADGAGARSLLARFVESQVRAFALDRPAQAAGPGSDGDGAGGGLRSASVARDEEARRAVERARGGQPDWAALPEAHRRAVVLRAAILIGEAGEEGARQEAKDAGTLIEWAAATITAARRWLEDLAGRPVGVVESFPPTASLQRVWNEPQGVVVACATDRSPFLGVSLQAAGALIAGNAVVVDAPPGAFGACSRLADHLARAGAPSVLQVVRSPGGDGSWKRGLPQIVFPPSAPVVVALKDADLDLVFDAVLSPRLPDEVCAPVVLVQRRLARRVLRELAERAGSGGPEVAAQSRGTPAKAQAAGGAFAHSAASPRLIAFDGQADLVDVLRGLGPVRRALLYAQDVGTACDLAASLPVDACVVNPASPLDDAVVALIPGPDIGVRRRRLAACTAVGRPAGSPGA